MFTSVSASVPSKGKILLSWQYDSEADYFRILWSDRKTPFMRMRAVWEGEEKTAVFERGTHIPHYFKVQAVKEMEEGDRVITESELFESEKTGPLPPLTEKLSRGLVALKTTEGVFLSWRLFKEEVTGFDQSGLTGTDFAVFKNHREIAVVTDSTNFLDEKGTVSDVYAVAARIEGKTGDPCECVNVNPDPWIDLPLHKPADGVTPKGDPFTYRANDMSIGDVDGDGEMEYILKWDPSNSRDVSQKGYTGPCLIDCYKLDGTLLWRLDMGANIRSGAHYT